MEQDKFVRVGIRPPEAVHTEGGPKWYQGKPLPSILVLSILVLGCLFCELFIPKDPTYMDLNNFNIPPNREFLFGTDAMGRDIFSMIWYGGRISLFIGFAAALISTIIAVIFGAVSGLAPRWLDALLMRFTEILLSVPSLLFIILIQAVLGKANCLSISFVIGLTGWTGIAKVVRTEVLRLRGSGFIVASRCMGGGFFHILWKHLTPNFISSIMFMVVMNIRSAIAAESTLSFMGIGLPLEIISWGSMLSLAEKAMLSKAWWMILIPGVFLVTALLCVTNIGNFLRGNVSRRHSNL